MKPPDILAVLEICIEQMWDMYDVDETGYLDREQSRKFFLDTIDRNDKDSLDSDQD